jgi:hypothetical protein
MDFVAGFPIAFFTKKCSMKNLLFAFLLLLSSLPGPAQTNTAPAQAIRGGKEDTAAITQTALNYIEGYYNADPQRMSRAIDPELAKRIILKDTAGDAIQNMGYSVLLLNTRKNKNSNILINGEPFKAVVTIYDIDNNIATAKVVTNKFKFIDYLHLGRVDGEWKIINVLWEFTAK